jgi:SAM-dependent methyltransferase
MNEIQRAERKKFLQKIYYKHVPKARRINPFFRAQFELLFDAAEMTGPETNFLNIFSSEDVSRGREDVYRNYFFLDCNYIAVDFWEDRFLDDPSKNDSEKRYQLPYGDGTFDIIFTTKVVMEHVSDPARLLAEFARLLKDGGRLYLIAPHVRRQHQKPYDYFRFTEYALDRLLTEASFRHHSTVHSGGFMAVVGYYLYFFQRGMGFPKPLERFFDFVHYWVFEPFFYFLDRYDNGYGRDMTLYFMIRAIK